MPGKPNIGVINLPFAVITDESAIIISEYLNYARRDDSIKAVVINIASPAAARPPASVCILKPGNCAPRNPWCW